MTESGRKNPTRTAKKRKRVETSDWQKPTYDDVKKAKIRSRYGLRTMKEIADCCGLDGINSASHFISPTVVPF
jgi:hypothetical protein